MNPRTPNPNLCCNGKVSVSVSGLNIIRDRNELLAGLPNSPYRNLPQDAQRFPKWHSKKQPLGPYVMIAGCEPETLYPKP